jgi:hypothetical protein
VGESRKKVGLASLFYLLFIERLIERLLVMLKGCRRRKRDAHGKPGHASSYRGLETGLLFAKVNVQASPHYESRNMNILPTSLRIVVDDIGPYTLR